MCSNAGRSGPPSRPEADLATRLAAAIDELAAAAGGTVGAGKDRIEGDCADQGDSELDSADLDRAEHDLAEHDLAERLARAWAMITAADPEVAARTAHYSRP
jgi:hypothetical protein